MSDNRPRKRTPAGPPRVQSRVIAPPGSALSRNPATRGEPEEQSAASKVKINDERLKRLQDIQARAKHSLEESTGRGAPSPRRSQENPRRPDHRQESRLPSPRENHALSSPPPRNPPTRTEIPSSKPISPQTTVERSKRTVERPADQHVNSPDRAHRQLPTPRAVVAPPVWNNPDTEQIIREQEEYVRNEVRKPYSPVSERYIAKLIRTIEVKKIDALYAESESTELTQADFLSEEGFYTWQDTSRDTRFQVVLCSMLNYWDVSMPLIPEDRSKKKNARKSVLETTVNLVIRVIEADGLIPHPKNKPRNVFALITYTPTQNTSSFSTTQDLRYQTKIAEDTLNPKWNQEMTLTVNNLIDPIVISLYDQREKSGFLNAGEVKEEFMGNAVLYVHQLIKKTAKEGFVNEWFDLVDNGKKSKSVGGRVLIEIEMGGILDGDSDDERDSPKTDIEKLKALRVRLVKFKVNLKSLYVLLLRYVIQLDLCPTDAHNLFAVPLKRTPWRITSDGQQVLDEFARVFSISQLFQKVKFLSIMFTGYQCGLIHARAVLQAYRQVYDDVFRRLRIHLPNYEKPVLIDLMTAIEVYTTMQIKNFKDFFPCGDQKPVDENIVDHITSSIDCILLLTRMIDKNDIFQHALLERKKSQEALKANEDQNNYIDHTSLEDEDDPFALQERLRQHDSASTISSAVKQRAAITEYDYKDGKFRFTEKLFGLVQSRAVLRFQQLSERANPPFSGKESIEITVYRCRELAILMMEEIEEDQTIYANGFKKENGFDLVAVGVETYLKYFVLEMENLRGFVREQVQSTGTVFSGSSVALTDNPAPAVPGLAADLAKMELTEKGKQKVPQNEDDVLYLALDLLEQVKSIRSKWKKYMPADHALVTSTLSWFSPFIKRFLDTTAKHAVKWAEQSVQIDDFSPGNNFYSSSVTDLYTAIFQSLDLVKRSIEGVNDAQLQRSSILTKFSRVAFEGISAYCARMESIEDSADYITVVKEIQSQQKTVGETVWNFFKQQPVDINPNEEVDAIRRQLRNLESMNRLVCVRLANLDRVLNRLKSLYAEMDGKSVTEDTIAWRKRKKVARPEADDKVTGLVRIRVLHAENLKARAAVYVGKTNPYVVIKRRNSRNTDWEEVARSSPVTDTLNPLFTLSNPTTLRREKYPFVMDSGQYVLAVENADEIKIFVHHYTGGSIFNFLRSGSDGPLLGEASVPLSYRKLIDAKGSLYETVNILPQGSMLVHVELKVEGIKDQHRTSLSSSVLDEQVYFGVGGVEDLEYWFMRMKARIGNARFSLIRRCLQQINSVLSPRLHAMLSDTTVSRNILHGHVDTQLGPVVEILNQVLSVFTVHLPDHVARHVIYIVYLKCILFPHLNYIKSTPFYHPVGANAVPVGDDGEKIVRGSLKMLVDFFHADGEGLGLPLELLKNCTGYCVNDVPLSMQLSSRLF